MAGEANVITGSVTPSGLFTRGLDRVRRRHVFHHRPGTFHRIFPRYPMLEARVTRLLRWVNAGVQDGRSKLVSKDKDKADMRR